MTGIAAYEVAKEKHLPCLYINTPNEEVVSLVKDVDKAVENLFDMSIRDYMLTQQRQRKKADEANKLYKDTVEKWNHIATLLALSPLTSSFIKVMRDKKVNDDIPFTSNFMSTSTFVQELESLGAIRIKRSEAKETTCSFTSNFYAKFIGKGDWLEMYVWSKVNEMTFASDCQWGYEMESTANNELNVVSTHKAQPIFNELDVVLTYKAQLIFAECKTESEPFHGKIHHLNDINTKAAMLGGAFVTKLFITSEPSSRNSDYSNFKEQAHLRKIVVATQEDLPTIGEILKREAITPTYPRI